MSHERHFFTMTFLALVCVAFPMLYVSLPLVSRVAAICVAVSVLFYLLVAGLGFLLSLRGSSTKAAYTPQTQRDSDTNAAPLVHFVGAPAGLFDLLTTGVHDRVFHVWRVAGVPSILGSLAMCVFFFLQVAISLFSYGEEMNRTLFPLFCAGLAAPFVSALFLQPRILIRDDEIIYSTALRTIHFARRDIVRIYISCNTGTGGIALSVRGRSRCTYFDFDQFLRPRLFVKALLDFGGVRVIADAPSAALAPLPA